MQPNEEEMSDNGNGIEVYKRRWLLLAATCLWTTINLYMSDSFGAANQLFAVYFETDLDEVDWMLLGMDAGTVIVTPIFAYLCHAELIGFRYMSITAIVSVLCSCFVRILTVLYPFLHSMLIPASFLLGVAYTVSFCIMTFFPVLWFPDNEVSIVIACLSASIDLGILLGAVIPTAIIKPIPHGILFKDSINATNELDDWKASTHDTLLWMFSSVAVTLCLLLIYVAICATDLPPKPPTNAMFLKRSSSTCTERKPDFESLKEFFSSTKRLFKNRTFLICASLLGITHNLIVVETLHASQIVGKFTHYSTKGLPNSVLSGLVVAAYTITGIIFVFFAAKLFQKYKCYSVQTVFGTSLGLCSGIGILLFYHYDILIGLFVGNIVFSSANQFSVIPLMEAVTRHTYPMNEVFVSVWLTGVTSLILIIISEIARVVSNYTSAGSTLIVMCVALFISFTLSLFFKPSDKRTDIDKGSTSTSEPEDSLYTPLINKK